MVAPLVEIESQKSGYAGSPAKIEHFVKSIDSPLCKEMGAPVTALLSVALVHGRQRPAEKLEGW